MVSHYLEDRIGTTRLVLIRGDITEQQVEAIVNSANPDLTPGGGVSGAIHRAGGSTVTAEAARIRREHGRLRTGEAVITSGGRLPAKWVIHTVGPVWHGGTKGEAKLLAQAYRSCLELALRRGIRSIAFPSISTGIYGYPIEQAARIALRTVREFLEEHPGALGEVRFVLYSPQDFLAYREAWERIRGKRRD